MRRRLRTSPEPVTTAPMISMASGAGTGAGVSTKVRWPARAPRTVSSRNGHDLATFVDVQGTHQRPARFE